MSEHILPEMLKKFLEDERRAADLREEVVRDLMNKVDQLKTELVFVRQARDFALAKISSIKHILDT